MSAISEKNQLVMSHQEYENIKQFHTGTSWKSRKIRTMTYIEEKKMSYLLLNSMRNVPQGAVIGGGIGITLGAVIGGASSGGTGALEGALLGGAIGVGVGAVSSIVATAVWDFSAWKLSNLEGQLKETFIKVQSENPLLKEFEDPITNEVMIHPVKTPCGHTYDKDSLIAAMERGMNKCAICRASLVNIKITEDIGTVAAIKKAYSKILREDIKKLEDKLGGECKHKILEGFRALRSQYIVQVKNHIKNASTQLSLELNAGIITVDVWGRKMNEVVQLSNDIQEDEKQEQQSEYRVPINLLNDKIARGEV